MKTTVQPAAKRENYAEKAMHLLHAYLSCRPMIPCGRHPVMADMLVTLVSAVHRPTRLSFPVVI